jgi:hypothetical protein
MVGLFYGCESPLRLLLGLVLLLLMRVVSRHSCSCNSTVVRAKLGHSARLLAWRRDLMVVLPSAQSVMVAARMGSSFLATTSLASSERRY